MRVRTFRVPFSRVAPKAVELEWGPDDYVVVRPLLARSPAEIAAIRARFAALSTEDSSEESREALLSEVFSDVFIEWHLTGEDGAPIPLPRTWAEVDALPSGLASVLFEFIYTYRGDGPTDPSTAGEPS